MLFQIDYLVFAIKRLPYRLKGQGHGKETESLQAFKKKGANTTANAIVA
jgi:hypothetical protein